MTLRTRISNAWTALTRPQNQVQADSSTVTTTGWGTAVSGRGTNVTTPLNRLHDMTPQERRTSIQRSRFIVNRLGLGRALVEGCTRYSVGGGIVPYAATGDRDYDDSCNRFVDSVFESRDFDLRGELPFYEMQEVVCPAMMTDGDCGAMKVLQRDGTGRVLTTPQLQLFTSEQIGSGLFMDTGEWCEGVKRNEYGRAMAYRVLQEPLPGRASSLHRGSWREIPANDFMLVLDPKRVGISRGLPWTHHGHESAITMMDLKRLEESAAYLNAFFGAVITTPNGDVPEGFEKELFKRRFNKTDENKSTAEEEETTTEGYRKYVNFMGGALIPVLQEGERLDMVKSERPSLTFTGFMDWLVNDIAWGFGIPPSFVWAIAGRTGPETRLTLNQADWFFQFIMRRMVSRFCKPTRDWVVTYGLLTGRINNGRPPRNAANPFLCRWHGPRKITIDEGREGKLEMDRIAHGLGTEEEFHARRGNEGDEVARKRIQEIRRRLDWCDEEGVPPALFFGPLPGQNMGLPGEPFDPAAGAADEIISR
jgi:capsid protein